MSSLQYSSVFVLIMALAVIGGNYLINRKQGMQKDENMRESRMWGAGFLVYAVVDYLILTL